MEAEQAHVRTIKVKLPYVVYLQEPLALCIKSHNTSLEVAALCSTYNGTSWDYRCGKEMSWGYSRFVPV
jgi:hypothetical protein